MQFGIFTVGDVTVDPTNGSVPTEHERIKAMVTLAKHAEDVGLDVFATGEHHNPPFVPSSPTTMLGFIAAQTEPLNPVSALNSHIDRSPELPRTAHLFAFTHPKSGETKVLTREHFLAKCNAIWAREGFYKITGHAFRIGGTSGLLIAGVPPEIVKVMGQETFLILPHPQVLDYMRAKAANYDRWIGGMQKIFLRQQQP